MYLPQYEKSFGSEFLTITVPNHGYNIQDTNLSFSYGQDYLLKRTHWKALDNEQQRCDQEDNAKSTTKCITEYLEEVAGCSMGLQGSNPTIARFFRMPHMELWNKTNTKVIVISGVMIQYN